MKDKTLVSVKALEEKRKEIWKDGGNTLLNAEISYISLGGSKSDAGIRRINRYYQHMCKQIIRYCKKELLPQVIRAYKLAKEKEEHFIQAGVYSKSKLTYNENGVLSVYTDITETGRYGSITIRIGDVWDLAKGGPILLSDFFPKIKNYKKYLKNHIIREATRIKDRGFGVYYDNIRKICIKHFSIENYYLADEGVVVFYPMYTIAPGREGIPTFTVKWNENGPCKPFSQL